MTDHQNNTASQFNKATEAGRETADRMARAGQAATERVSSTVEQTARASAEVFQKGTETARSSLQSGLETAKQGFQRMNDQFTQVLGFSGPQAEELTRRSSENIQALTEAGSVLAKGAQDVSREWLGYAQDRQAKNMECFKRLTGCRSVQDLMTVQSDLVRDSFQALIATNKRVAELSLRFATDAATRVQAQADGSRRAA
jgi:phasin family protein